MEHGLAADSTRAPPRQRTSSGSARAPRCCSIRRSNPPCRFITPRSRQMSAVEIGRGNRTCLQAEDGLAVQPASRRRRAPTRAPPCRSRASRQSASPPACSTSRDPLLPRPQLGIRIAHYPVEVRHQAGRRTALLAELVTLADRAGMIRAHVPRPSLPESRRRR